MKKIILASASPRRKELLEQIGIPFTVIPAKGEEVICRTIPSEAVAALSLQKAAEVAAQIREPAVIIGADTLVAQRKRIMGKPAGKEDAFEMLSGLQGKTHKVYTGVTVIVTNDLQGNAFEKKFSFVEETEVTLYPMSDLEILAYITTGEPMGKAGAYAIQGRGAAYIRCIRGDYNTVVGLPLSRLYHLLKTL